MWPSATDPRSMAASHSDTALRASYDAGSVWTADMSSGGSSGAGSRRKVGGQHQRRGATPPRRFVGSSITASMGGTTDGRDSGRGPAPSSSQRPPSPSPAPMYASVGRTPGTDRRAASPNPGRMTSSSSGPGIASTSLPYSTVGLPMSSTPARGAPLKRSSTPQPRTSTGTVATDFYSLAPSRGAPSPAPAKSTMGGSARGTSPMARLSAAVSGGSMSASMGPSSAQQFVQQYGPPSYGAGTPSTTPRSSSAKRASTTSSGAPASRTSGTPSRTTSGARW